MVLNVVRFEKMKNLINKEAKSQARNVLWKTRKGQDLWIDYFLFYQMMLYMNNPV